MKLINPKIQELELEQDERNKLAEAYGVLRRIDDTINAEFYNIGFHDKGGSIDKDEMEYIIDMLYNLVQSKHIEVEKQ